MNVFKKKKFIILTKGGPEETECTSCPTNSSSTSATSCLCNSPKVAYENQCIDSCPGNFKYEYWNY